MDKNSRTFNLSIIGFKPGVKLIYFSKPFWARETTLALSSSSMITWPKMFINCSTAQRNERLSKHVHKCTWRHVCTHVCTCKHMHAYALVVLHSGVSAWVEPRPRWVRFDLGSELHSFRPLWDLHCLRKQSESIAHTHTHTHTYTVVLLLLKCLGVCSWRPHLWGLEDGWHPLLFLSSKHSVLSFCQEKRISLCLSLFFVKKWKQDGWLSNPVGIQLSCCSVWLRDCDGTSYPTPKLIWLTYEVCCLREERFQTESNFLGQNQNKYYKTYIRESSFSGRKQCRRSDHITSVPLWDLWACHSVPNKATEDWRDYCRGIVVNS